MNILAIGANPDDIHLANLWPGWIVQLVHISLTWRTSFQ